METQNIDTVDIMFWKYLNKVTVLNKMLIICFGFIMESFFQCYNVNRIARNQQYCIHNNYACYVAKRQN